MFLIATILVCSTINSSQPPLPVSQYENTINRFSRDAHDPEQVATAVSIISVLSHEELETYYWRLCAGIEGGAMRTYTVENFWMLRRAGVKIKVFEGREGKWGLRRTLEEQILDQWICKGPLTIDGTDQEILQKIRDRVHHLRYILITLNPPTITIHSSNDFWPL